MKSYIKLSTRQQLALTPQVQQTIRMLQLGAKELSEEIDETLNNNPLLSESRTYQKTISQSEDFSSWLENQAEQQTQTLEDHLIGQLGYLNLNSQDYVIICIIISRLEEDGYLRLTTKDLIQICADEQIHANEKQIEQTITTIQRLDPSGTASRSLSECLSLQTNRKKCDDEIKNTALQIIQQLDLLAKNRHELFNNLDVGLETFDAALDLIQQLDPAPGKAFEQHATVYIQPDVFLTQSGNRLVTQLNPVINRSLELNQGYIDLLKQSGKKRDKEYLTKNLDKAKWWLNALVQRNQTLLSVSEFMINHQVEYLKTHDPIDLKPLKQQQIADALEIHISTVSRAIRDKYLQAPIGIVALKKLLAVEIKNDNEKTLSNHAVKSIIKNLIKNESSQTPLSDSKIVVELKTRGIVIARRTVNKYRDQLNIPASNRRKVINT